MRPYPSTDLKRYGLPVSGCSISLTSELVVRYTAEAYLTRVSDQELANYVHDRSCKTLQFVADYLLAAAIGEARHWSHRSWAGVFGWMAHHRKLAYGPLFSLKSTGSMGSRSVQSTSGWNLLFERHDNPATVARIVEDFFNHTPWNSSYGGPSWAYVANFAAMLYELDYSDYFQVFTALDKVVHVAHTGASMLLQPKFDWIFSGYLPPVVGMAFACDLCCWLHPAIGAGVNEDFGLSVTRAQKDLPLDRMRQWLSDEGKKIMPKHNCLSLISSAFSCGSTRSLEQKNYVQTHPGIPSPFALEFLCFRCGRRYDSKLKRCPRWCATCGQCVDHAKEYHVKAKKKKGQANGSKAVVPAA